MRPRPEPRPADGSRRTLPERRCNVDRNSAHAAAEPLGLHVVDESGRTWSRRSARSRMEADPGDADRARGPDVLVVRVPGRATIGSPTCARPTRRGARSSRLPATAASTPVDRSVRAAERRRRRSGRARAESGRADQLADDPMVRKVVELFEARRVASGMTKAIERHDRRLGLGLTRESTRSPLTTRHEIEACRVRIIWATSPT